jgi:hypothetical protein
MSSPSTSSARCTRAFTKAALSRSRRLRLTPRVTLIGGSPRGPAGADGQTRPGGLLCRR